MLRILFPLFFLELFCSSEMSLLGSNFVVCCSSNVLFQNTMEALECRLLKFPLQLINQGQNSQLFDKIGFTLNEFIQNCKNKNQITQGVNLSFSEVNWESSRNTEIASSEWEILMFRKIWLFKFLLDGGILTLNVYNNLALRIFTLLDYFILVSNLSTLLNYQLIFVHPYTICFSFTT